MSYTESDGRISSPSYSTALHPLARIGIHLRPRNLAKAKAKTATHSNKNHTFAEKKARRKRLRREEKYHQNPDLRKAAFPELIYAKEAAPTVGAASLRWLVIDRSAETMLRLWSALRILSADAPVHRQEPIRRKQTSS